MNPVPAAFSGLSMKLAIRSSIYSVVAAAAVPGAVMILRVVTRQRTHGAPCSEQHGNSNGLRNRQRARENRQREERD